jgi:hypothetical protein
MEPIIFLVRMWEVDGQGELGPFSEVVVQLSDIEGRWFADFRQNNWAYANLALLKGLKEKGLRFLGTLPNFDPRRLVTDSSFWVITEPLVAPRSEEQPRRDNHRRDHDGY